MAMLEEAVVNLSKLSRVSAFRSTQKMSLAAARADVDDQKASKPQQEHAPHRKIAFGFERHHESGAMASFSVPENPLPACARHVATSAS